MKILMTAAAAAFAVAGIQIADKQAEVVPDEVMPKTSFSEEASWAETIKNAELFCIFSFNSDASKKNKDGCD